MAIPVKVCVLVVLCCAVIIATAPDAAFAKKAGGGKEKAGQQKKKKSRKLTEVEGIMAGVSTALEKGEFREVWALIFGKIREMEDSGKLDELSLQDQLYLLKEASRLARHLRQFSDSLEYNMLLLQGKAKKGATAFSLLQSFLEISYDYKRMQRYNKALEWVELARTRLAGEITDEAAALIDRAEADVHFCTGNVPAAYEYSQLSMKHVGRLAGGDQLFAFMSHSLYANVYRQERMMALMQTQGCDLETGECDGDNSHYSSQTSLEELKEIQSEFQELVKENFNYKHGQQVPMNYERGLRALPFHSVERSYDAVKEAAAIMKRFTTRLSNEYAGLKASGVVYSDTDCIKHPDGEWKRYEVMAAWDSIKRDSNGCNMVDTPVACKLLGELAGIDGIVVTRMGYSAVSPRTWIRPHYGASNRRLKLHLGLDVPSHPPEMGLVFPPDITYANLTATVRHDLYLSKLGKEKGREVPHTRDSGDGDDGDDLSDEELRQAFLDRENMCTYNQCAVMRVGDEARCWRQGEVLMLDDSFLHEVYNACKQERVVLQVVIAHPELTKAQLAKLQNLITIEAA